ncbi:MAG: ABC transporter ATP-binding protein [Gemmatimonadetes bacterium]|nr:ABC transporter ATP-binding protein [Gemmatimonadota bacterium]
MTAPALEVRGLHVSYPDRRRGASAGTRFPAVQGVDLRIDAGEAVGLVGESGSGKSTIARALVGVADLDSGSITCRGDDLIGLRRRNPGAAARRVQMVFQDVSGALDPRQRIGAALREALSLHGLLGDDGGEARIASLLDEVGLPHSFAERYPHRLSGGQRQRVGIARALAVEPDVLVLDEPVSALDVSVQAHILGLLDRLRMEREVALLLIAHDLGVVRNVCRNVAVLYRGRVVESGPTETLFSDPRHPYTRDLLRSVPRVAVTGEPPFAYPLGDSEPVGSEHPDGCPYASRCTHPGRDGRCEREAPPLGVVEHGHSVACWREGEQPRSGA